MNEESKDKMAINSQMFLDLSHKMLSEAMAACQIENFQGVSLSIPQEISATGFSQAPFTQEQLWDNIQQLYQSQENLMQASPPVPSPDIQDESDS